MALRLLVCLLAFALMAVAAAPAHADHGGGAVVEEDWGGGEGWPEEEQVPVETGGEELPDVDIEAVPIEDLPGALPAPAPSPAPAPAPTPAPAGGGVSANVPYGALIASTARRHGVPVALFTALVRQESAFNPRAKSHAGARGLCQLMPATARGLGVTKPYDPAQSLRGGAQYLGTQLRRFRSKRLALAAYNAGPGAVARFKGIPPYAETRNYVKRILAYEAAYRRAGVK